MTAIVKHTIRSKPGAAGTPGSGAAAQQPAAQAVPAQARRQEWWPATAQGEDEVLRRLTSPPFLAGGPGRPRPDGAAARPSCCAGCPPSRKHLAAAVGACGAEAPGSSWLPLPLGWLRDNGG